MPSPNSTFTELVSTTFRDHRKSIKDNISQNNALLAVMTQKGRMRMVDGGLTIVEPLEYAENGTYQRYSGYDSLNIQASDVITSAEFSWRQAAVHVTASGREMRINKGKNAFLDLVKTRTQNAIKSFKNNFSSDLYSDGTLSNQINGLQSIIADSGQGTVGGINAATSTNAFWRNIVQSAAAPLQGGGAITPSASTIESLMLPLWLACTIGNDSPDLIVADTVYYTYFETSQVSVKRYTDSDTAQGGFISLRYKNAKVVYDGDSGIPASHMYFINTDNLRLAVHPDADITVLDDIRPTNQDAVVIPAIWMGNLVCSSRRTQGVLKA